jgi:DMSO reductase anchor subunit
MEMEKFRTILTSIQQDSECAVDFTDMRQVLRKLQLLQYMAMCNNVHCTVTVIFTDNQSHLFINVQMYTMLAGAIRDWMMLWFDTHDGADSTYQAYQKLQRHYQKILTRRAKNEDFK